MNNSQNGNSESSEIKKLHSYWKSFRDLNNDPEIREAKANEFMKGVTDDFDLSKLSNVSRRKFLAVLSSSIAFAAAGCSEYPEKGEIVPYNKRPEEVIPGIPNYYASTCTACSNACGILIKTREGRPIKVDGNPDHPINKGKICSKGQASPLNLYDPGRLIKPLKSNGGKFSETTWSSANDEIINALNQSRSEGKEISIITRNIYSPTGRKVIDDFISKYPNTRVYSFELFNDMNRTDAWIKSYGSNIYPLIKWDEAKVIISLEGDFLGVEGNSVENARLFAQNRDVMKSPDFNRLYVVEGAISVTGMNADYRMRLRPDAQLEFVLSIISEVSKQLGTASGLNKNYSLVDFSKKFNLNSNELKHMISDLLSNSGAAIVYAGNQLPVDVHVAVNYLNEMLGNTKLYNQAGSPVDYSYKTTRQNIDELIQKINNKNVGVLINYDANPVYHLPMDYGFTEALKNVPVIISLDEYENETSVLGRYQLPINHDFESWGDFHTRTGVYSLQQPVIAPLYDTRQKEAVMLTWTVGDKGVYKENLYHQYLMNNWETNIYPRINTPIEFKLFWYTALELGVVLFNENPAASGTFNRTVINSLTAKSISDGYNILLKESYTIGDGRYANNGWLQELPHPVTKVVWDNYASISYNTAEKLGVKNNDLIEITVDGRRLTIPVFLQPGTDDKVIEIELGYGRKKAGEVGTDVGFNANVLMSKNPGLSSWLYSNAKVVKAEGNYKIVSTVEHHSLDDEFVKDIHLKRGIILESTVESFKENPNKLIKEKREYESLNKTAEYTGVKWGMGIDLNKCLGCNQCTVACVVENNIPVVGKEQVDRGREMHWLRIDSYYSGTNEDPVVSNQPMLCQHCDKAPCENVCPVVATTHSPDGLNQMAYNRCVGTRYCSNNCPYKVRRFNFFNFRDHFADGYYQQEPIELVYNPEVTVRSRGVMEKCTFCIQRIMQAREDAIEQNRPLKGSDVETACQQACPTNAIVFGDMNDPESIVSKYHKHGLSYYVLEEINTRPNIAYLAKLRNTVSEDKS